MTQDKLIWFLWIFHGKQMNRIHFFWILNACAHIIWNSVSSYYVSLFRMESWQKVYKRILRSKKILVLSIKVNHLWICTKILCFFFFEKIDQKNNCRFGEILTWSENMLFWGDFRSLIQKNVILGRFSGIKNDQNSFFTLLSKSVILGIQEFQLTVHKENVIMGRFGLHICSTMKILRERIVVHILKSVVLGRFGGINRDCNS